MLLVLLLHGLLIEVLIRELSREPLTGRESSDGLLVYLLAREESHVREVPNAQRPANAPSVSRAFRRIAPIKHEPGALAAPPIETLPATPQVDWQHELELSAQDFRTDDQKEKTYRDLAKSMSPSQVDWLKQHQMEPASPGLTWARPRVEITKDGLPIVHINDHCVLVPLLFMPMVFCGIGHIEPNGELFKHMRNRKPP